MTHLEGGTKRIGWDLPIWPPLATIYVKSDLPQISLAATSITLHLATSIKTAPSKSSETGNTTNLLLSQILPSPRTMASTTSMEMKMAISIENAKFQSNWLIIPWGWASPFPHFLNSDLSLLYLVHVSFHSLVSPSFFPFSFHHAFSS